MSFRLYNNDFDGFCEFAEIDFDAEISHNDDGKRVAISGDVENAPKALLAFCAWRFFCHGAPTVVVGTREKSLEAWMVALFRQLQAIAFRVRGQVRWSEMSFKREGETFMMPFRMTMEGWDAAKNRPLVMLPDTVGNIAVIDFENAPSQLLESYDLCEQLIVVQITG